MIQGLLSQNIADDCQVPLEMRSFCALISHHKTATRSRSAPLKILVHHSFSPSRVLQHKQRMLRLRSCSDACEYTRVQPAVFPSSPPKTFSCTKELRQRSCSTRACTQTRALAHKRTRVHMCASLRALTAPPPPLLPLLVRPQVMISRCHVRVGVRFSAHGERLQR